MKTRCTAGTAALRIVAQRDADRVPPLLALDMRSQEVFISGGGFVPETVPKLIVLSDEEPQFYVQCIVVKDL